MKKRQREILKALGGLGGTATTREIATELKLPVNGVSQSLSALDTHVEYVDGRSGDTRWRLR